jgi:hypothetical protein
MGINGTSINGKVNGSDGPSRRRERRKPVIWAARLETEDGTVDCAAFDISVGGAKLRLEEPVALHRPVRLVLDRFGALRAEAIWRRGGTLGLRFGESPETVRQMLGDALTL